MSWLRTCAANTLSSSAPIKLGRGSSVLAARSTHIERRHNDRYAAHTHDD